MVCYIQQEDSAPVRQNTKGSYQNTLEVQGYVECCSGKEDKTIREKVYVVRKLGQPLLGRPAIERLKLLSRVDFVVTNTETGRIPMETQYQDVFQKSWDISRGVPHTSERRHGSFRSEYTTQNDNAFIPKS